MASRPRLAVTLGDPRGIGPEVVARALATPLEAEITLIGADDQIARLTAARKVGVGAWEKGQGEEAAGRLAGRSVEHAVRLALAGEVDAIVTGPVHKHALHRAGFRYPGLTELLSHLTGDSEVAMMLAAGRALGEKSPALADPSASLLPRVRDLRDIAAYIAIAIGRQAQRDGVAPQTSDAELRQRIAATQWTPAYPSFAA